MAKEELTLEHERHMKTNKITPEAKADTTSKAPTATKASPSVKSAPVLKSKARARGAPQTKASPARVAKASQSDTAAPQDHDAQPDAHTPDAVRARAYMNYQKRGSEIGDHTDDWLRAEAELTAERHMGRA
jgi:hypothetical protein